MTVLIRATERPTPWTNDTTTSVLEPIGFDNDSGAAVSQLMAPPTGVASIPRPPSKRDSHDFFQNLAPTPRRQSTCSDPPVTDSTHELSPPAFVGHEQDTKKLSLEVVLDPDKGPLAGPTKGTLVEEQSPDYDVTNDPIERQIIGLPSATSLYDW